MSWPLIFCLLFVALALWCLLDGVYRVYLSWCSLSWPTYDGVVVTNRIQRYLSKSEGLPWQHDFLIEYQCGTSKFRQNKPCPGWYATTVLGSYGLKLARNVVYKFPVGSVVKLWVHPQQPSRAVLLPGINRLCWVNLFFLPTLFSVCAALCYLSYLHAG